MCKKKINNQRRIILQTGPGGLDKKKKKKIKRAKGVELGEPNEAK